MINENDYKHEYLEDVAGNEKMLYGAFLRQEVCFRRSDIPKKIKTFNNKTQLPTNSVLHLLDNINKPNNFSDTPDIMGNPFVINEVFRKFIDHNTTIVQPNNKFYIKLKHMFRIAGINPTLLEFRNKYKDVVRPMLNKEGVLKSNNILSIVNHNPLWRIRTMGVMNEYNKFNLIFRSILQYIVSMSHTKFHFIHIPLSEKIYSKMDFQRAAKERIDRATVKFRDDFTYFLLIHLYGYLMEDSKTSLLNELPSDILPYLHFIFQAKDKYVIYNLNDLKNIITNESMIISVRRQIDTLKFNYIEEVIDENISDDDYEKAVEEKQRLSTEKASSATTKSPTVGISSGDKVKEKSETTKDIKKIDTKSIDKPVVTKNVAPKIKIDTEFNFESAQYDDFLKEIEKEVEQLIDDLEDVTPNQKVRLRKVSEQYKDIKIDNKTVEEILKEDVDISITSSSLDFLKDSIPDESMLHSSIIDMDNLYMEKLFMKDLLSVATSFNAQGMFLVNFEQEEMIDELNHQNHVKMTYEDTAGKRHTIKFKLPVIRKDGTFIVNGIKSRMRKQQVNLPICKISPTRVSLASNYNKTLVERNISKSKSFNEYIKRLIDKSDKNIVSYSYGTMTYENRLPYEYTTLGVNFSTLKIDSYILNFDYNNRNKLYSGENLTELESTYGVLCGTTKNLHIFMGMDNILRVVDTKLKEVSKTTTIIDLFNDLASVSLPTVPEYTDLKILDKKLPIIFVLGYRFGLTKILEYLKIDYRIIEGNSRADIAPTDIVIRFADKKIVINRYPLSKSLIVSGLLIFNTKEYDYDLFDMKDIYYSLLTDKGWSINYLKGITSFFDLFIDPQTRDVLIDMKEPITVRDLLIRATEMLTDEFAIDASSMANHRMRSYERFSSILYNEMARQLSSYKNQKGRNLPYSINPEAILQRIIQDQTVIAVEDINPIADIKEKTGFTFTGMGGRTAQSFVLADRKYPKDAIGIISESTPDSGKVAITAFTSANPKIKDIRGMFDINSTNLDPTNILSMPALLMPGVTNDDPKRCNFATIQLSHHVPCLEGETSRVCTGYEKIIAHRASSGYAVAAEDNGKVISIDETLGILKVEYPKKNKIEAVKFGEYQGSAGGIFINQNVVPNVKEGDTVKRGDILVYNEGFFKPEVLSKQVNWKHGVHANVAILESDDTLEDGSTISKRLGKRLSMKPTHLRTIKLTKNTVVHDMIKIGDVVEYPDPLCVIEDQDISDLSIMNTEDPEALDLIASLNKKTPKAKHAGYIVDINVLHACPVSDMTPSLAKLVRQINNVKTKKHNTVKGTEAESLYPLPTLVPKGTKVKDIEFDSDTVAFFIYISEDIDAGIGDKVVFDSSLKSVIGNVLENPIMSSSGLEVDALFGASSISNRIILSPLRIGILNRVIAKLEEEVVSMYFDTK